MIVYVCVCVCVCVCVACALKKEEGESLGTRLCVCVRTLICEYTLSTVWYYPLCLVKSFILPSSVMHFCGLKVKWNYVIRMYMLQYFFADTCTDHFQSAFKINRLRQSILASA